MSKNYKIGLVIEGDGKGGVKAIKATDDALAKLDKQTRNTQKETKSLGENFKGMATKAAGVTAAIAGVAAIAGSFATVLRTDVIKEMRNTSDAFDVSVEALSTWSYGAERVGISSEKMADIFKDTGDKLGDFIATQGGEAKDLFENLNLEITELVGLSPDEQLIKIAEALDDVGTKGEQIFFMESLADEASRLLPLLSNGAKGLKDLKREAEILGVALDDVDAEMVAEAARTFDTLSGAAEGFANQLTVKVSGGLSGMGDDLVDLIEDWGGMEEIVDDVVETTINGIGFVLNGLQRFAIFLKTVQFGWESIGGIVAEFLTGLEDGLATIINLTLKPFASLLGKIGEIVAIAADKLGSFFGESGKGMQEFAAAVRSGISDLDNFYVSGDDVSGILDTMKGAADQTRAELDEMRQSAPGDEFVQDFKEAQEETRKQAEATVEAKEAAKGSAEAIEKQRESLKKAAEASKATRKEAAAYAKAWEKAVERIDTAFADGWLDIIQGNATNVFDSILDGFQRMLAEMAHEAITKPIVMEIQAQTSGLFGGQGGGLGGLLSGEGGGLGSLLSGGASGLLSSVSGLLSGTGIGSVFADFGGFLGSEFGLFTNNFGGTLFGQAGTISNAAYGFAGALGGLFGSTAGNNGGIGGGLGALIGTAAAGPIGAVIGGALGSAVGSLIGSDWETADQGVRLSYQASNGLTASDYLKEKKDRGLWRGNKYRESYTNNDELTSSLGAIMDNVVTSVRNAADVLGVTSVTTTSSLFSDEDFANLFGKFDQDSSFGRLFGRINDQSKRTETKSLDDFLEEFSFNKTLSFKGLDEAEATQLLTDYMTGQSNALVTSVFGSMFDEFRQDGELLVDTLGRVVAQLQLVDTGFESINLSLETLAQRAGMTELAFSDDVVNAAGGGERLTALLSGYQSAFFTEEELLERSLNALASQVKGNFSELGLTYGDDFRSRFEAASNRGLSADEVVAWLEAGNVLGQFNEIAAQLAELQGVDASDIAANAYQQAIIQASQGYTYKSVSSTSEPTETIDPVVSEMVALNETFNSQIGSANEHLTSVNERLKTVDDRLDKTLKDFKSEVKDLKTGTDSQISETQKQIQSVVKSLSENQKNTTQTIQDVARLVGSARNAATKYISPTSIK